MSPHARRRQPVTIAELLERVVVCPSGCWIWAGGDSGEYGRGAGYGRILRPGTRNAMAAHRYVYQVFVGPIPPGCQVDHICRAWAWHPTAGRRCVNPDHLEAVPPGVNQVRRNLALAGTRALPLGAPVALEVAAIAARPEPAPLLAPGETAADLAADLAF